MALSTDQYGYLIDPLVPITDATGTTIKDGFLRVYIAGSSTPVITYRNYDGAANEQTIELDNSGRCKYPVIVSKSLAYKVVVYDAQHSQETPIITVDKMFAIGTSVTAGAGSTIVQGLDNVEGESDGFVKASVTGTTASVKLDATNVSHELTSDAAVGYAANAGYMVPALSNDSEDPGDPQKLPLAWIWGNRLNAVHTKTEISDFADDNDGFLVDSNAGPKFMKWHTLANKVLGFIKSLSTTITAFRTGDVIPVDGPSGTAKMSITSNSSDMKPYILRAGEFKAIDDVASLDDSARRYKMIAGDASEMHPSGTVDAQRIVRDGIDYRVEECAVLNGTTTNTGNLYCVRCVPTIQVKKGDVVFVSTSRTLSDGDSYSFGFFELDAMYQRVTVDGHTIQRNIGNVKNYDGNDCYVVQSDLTVYVGISLGEFSPSGAVVAIRQTDFDDDFVIRYYGQDSLVFLTDFIEEQSKKIDSTNAKVSSNLSKIEAINEAELLASGKEYELTGATSSRTVSVNLAKGSKIRLDVPEYTKTGSGTAQFFVRSQQGYLGTMTGVGTRIITLTQDTTFLTFGYAISGEVTSVSVKYALNFDVANNDTTDYIDLCAGTKFSLNGGEYKTFACRFPKGSYKFSVSNSVTSGTVAFYVRNPSFTYSAQLTDDGSKTFTLSDAVDFLTISSAGNVTSFDFTLEKVDDVVEVQKIVISPDGEYTTLRAGFAAITSADAEVYVEAGEYDIIAEFGDSYFENFDDAVSNRHGIFVGDTGTVKVYFSTKAKVTCNYEGNNPLVFKNFSPFLILGPHVEIYGLWLRSKNVRYAIHDDANESTSMFRLYENCDIEHTITEDNTNANYHCCIGGGLHNDTNVVVRNCVFALGDLYTSPDAVSYHNGYASGAKSQVSIVNNYFKGVSTFRASWYGSSTEKTQVLVTGNSFGSAPLFFAEKPDQFDVHNMDWLEWNNIVR